MLVYNIGMNGTIARNAYAQNTSASQKAIKGGYNG